MDLVITMNKVPEAAAELEKIYDKVIDLKNVLKKYD